MVFTDRQQVFFKYVGFEHRVREGCTRFAENGLGEVVATDGLFECRLVDDEGIGEEKLDILWDLTERRDAFLDEGRHLPIDAEIKALLWPSVVISGDERHRPGDEFLNRQRANVEAIEVVEALLVEERRRLIDVLKAELRGHGFEIEHFASVFGAPPKETEVVQHCLGEISQVSVVLDGHAVPALGELLTLLVHKYREVRENRKIDLA